MIRAALLALGGLVMLAGCAHPEDRRWTAMTPATADSLPLPVGERPTVMVYGFAPPKPDATKPSIRDYSDRGQAMIIAAMAANSPNPDAFRKALATPIAAAVSGGSDDRTKLARTIVVSISKGPASLPGDRLVRTIVTLTPTRKAGQPAPFEFAGYTVAATDNKVQSIAHLEDETDLSLTGTISPTIKATGDNSLIAGVTNKRTATADIAQQYENLNVDISTDQLIVTRESERGLDVVGNTLIALTLAAAQDVDVPQAFAVAAQKLFDGSAPLEPAKATLAISPLSVFARHDLKVDVTVHYLLRRIVSGREFYTEGKQAVQLVSGDTRSSSPSTLVRAIEAQPPLYVICRKALGHPELMAQTADDRANPLAYDTLDDAKAMIEWLSKARRSTIGTDGLSLVVVKDQPLPPGGVYYPMPYAGGCNPMGRDSAPAKHAP